MIVRHNIGDKVISLKDSPNKFAQPRIKGQIYTVNDINYCPKCGEQSINIGYNTSFEETECSCGCSYNNNNKLWTLSKYFANVTTTINSEHKESTTKEKLPKTNNININ